MKLYQERLIQLNEGRIKDNYKCTVACEKQIRLWKTTVPSWFFGGVLGYIVASFYSKRGLLSRLCNSRCYVLSLEKALKEDPDKIEKNREKLIKAKQFYKERDNAVLERAEKLKKLERKDALRFITNHYKDLHRIKIK